MQVTGGGGRIEDNVILNFKWVGRSNNYSLSNLFSICFTLNIFKHSLCLFLHFCTTQIAIHITKIYIIYNLLTIYTD